MPYTDSTEIKNATTSYGMQHPGMTYPWSSLKPSKLHHAWTSKLQTAYAAADQPYRLDLRFSRAALCSGLAETVRASPASPIGLVLDGLAKGRCVVTLVAEAGFEPAASWL